MANEQNLKPITSTSRARELGRKGRQKRTENERALKTFCEVFKENLTEEDKAMIARRAKTLLLSTKTPASSFAALLTVVRDTSGEKPKDTTQIEVNDGAATFKDYVEVLKNGKGATQQEQPQG